MKEREESNEGGSQSEGTVVITPGSPHRRELERRKHFLAHHHRQTGGNYNR